MKKTTKKTTMIASALFSLSTLSSVTALAGKHWGTEVVIDAVNRKAYGSMGTVRASADSYQEIGCQVQGLAGALTTVVCEAVDSSNHHVQCGTSNQSIVQAAQSIASNSFVSFQWDVQGTCTALVVYNSSHNDPIQP